QPGMWDRLSTFGAAGRRWSQQDGWLANEVRAAQHALDAAQRVDIPEDTWAQPPMRRSWRRSGSWRWPSRRSRRP
ncbi:MAG: hypothetical protein M3R46_05455, partial [Actinomycetota bacterium]|nr:hypothetical protein [Actinomycetota bacterium]